ncbi:GAF domain-containing protein [Pseudoroseomonas globiformis]|uniref:GAF domain-containing protein n=1 Tax=Teichococcus globiformis TaxID=2307229 RepID=A0ABV7G5H6_9PROT
MSVSQSPSASGQQNEAASRAEALRELGTILRQAGHDQDLQAEVASLVGRALGASRVGFAWLDRDRLNIAEDWTAPTVACIAGNYSTDLFVETINRLGSGQAIAVNDTEGSPWLRGDRGAYASIGVRAFIKVPVSVAGALSGILFVHSAEPRDWSFSEIDFAREAAEQFSHALGSRQSH